HVLQRNPNSAHKGGRHRVEVDRVRVNGLLGPKREVERLKWEGLSTIELLQHRKNLGGPGQGLDVFADDPGVHQSISRVQGTVDSTSPPAPPETRAITASSQDMRSRM